MILNYRCIFTLVIFLSALGLGQEISEQVSFHHDIEVGSFNISSAKEQIEYNVLTMQTDPILKNANWGFIVYDPTTQSTITSYNEHGTYIPASTTKLLTTETAISYLGSKFKWITQLEYSGEIDDDGVLNGNLYIVGSGDPSIGTGKAGSSTYKSIIADFIYALRSKGIYAINGDIITQTVFFQRNNIYIPSNIVWKKHRDYLLPVGSTQNIDPKHEKLVTIENPFDTDGSFFYISPYSGKMVYTNEFNKTPYSDGKLPDTPYSLANNLRSSLIKNGIPVSGKVIVKTYDPTPEERQEIIQYQSPELNELVYFINQTSDNNLSESLLKITGFYKNGDLSLETGIKTVNQHLEEKSYDFSGLTMADGSGLSRKNTVTPISQVKFLSALIKEKHFESYFNSLPIAGQTGTLKSSFVSSPAYGHIFAKTGTLNGVKTLSGYVKTYTGRLLAFSLLINNYSGSIDQIKKKMEIILEPMVNL